MKARCGQRSPLPGVLTLASAIVIALTINLPGTIQAHEADGHPARIHEGTCEAMGPVTDRLTGVGAEISLTGTPIPTPEVVGSEAAFPITMSDTQLETTTSDLIDMPHAIVVYESDEAMDMPLVCGNVGGALLMQMPGMPMPGDELAIWLAPQGTSTYTGLALLQSDVGGTSTVTILLAQGLAGGVEAGDHDEHDDEHATPEATPTSG